VYLVYNLSAALPSAHAVECQIRGQSPASTVRLHLPAAASLFWPPQPAVPAFGVRAPRQSALEQPFGHDFARHSVRQHNKICAGQAYCPRARLQVQIICQLPALQFLVQVCAARRIIEQQRFPVAVQRSEAVCVGERTFAQIPLVALVLSSRHYQSLARGHKRSNSFLGTCSNGRFTIVSVDF
jgi:hypothetical protein